MNDYASYDFPDIENANKDGLVAVGGNLSLSTLINAYSKGIFPWYSAGSPILWWSPDPRMVLFPSKLKVSSSLHQVIKSQKFQVRFDTDFTQVINHCATVQRKDQKDTWITKEMKLAYNLLHQEKIAHSVETYFEHKLVGGLYGIALGKIFFGESMFHFMSNASKVALYYLVEKLKSMDFLLIDVQQSTQHLKSLGAEDILRNEFKKYLHQGLENNSISTYW